jgi:glycine hydroxymethyltransferase
MMSLITQDPEVYEIIKNELDRQKHGLEMIPSENLVSMAVLEANGSVLTNKYSEGYPGKRYYGGNENIDEVENLARDRAKRLFGVPHVNVQAYSGSPANLAVYLATCQPGDTIMGLNLTDGGHLTHGWKVSATAIFYKSVPYHVKADGYIDLDEVRRLAKEHRPKLIWCGATAYAREIPFKEFAEIADECGAYFAADIAHIAGLVAAGAHTSPVPYAQYRHDHDTQDTQGAERSVDHGHRKGAQERQFPRRKGRQGDIPRTSGRTSRSYDRGHRCGSWRSFKT